MARSRGEVTDLNRRCEICHGDNVHARHRHQLCDFGDADSALQHVRAQFPEMAYPEQFKASWARERRRLEQKDDVAARRRAGLEAVGSIIEKMKPRVVH